VINIFIEIIRKIDIVFIFKIVFKKNQATSSPGVIFFKKLLNFDISNYYGGIK